jgi:predicted DNA-binding transcriptional regulator AlpA
MRVVTRTSHAKHAGRRFVRFPDLKPEFGIDYSRMHLGRLEKVDRFPKRVRLGPNSFAWL